MTAVSDSSPLVLGVDIGGTKVAFGLVDGSGRVVDRDRVPTPAGDPASCLEEILEHARQFVAGRARACGIALPAVVDAGRVAWAAETIPDWRNLDIAAAGSAVLGVPCVAEFDGYAATIGEAWIGGAAGYAEAVVVIVGTGIGAGIIHQGLLYRGGVAIAGGVGWMRWPTRDGLSEKLESIGSGPAICAYATSASKPSRSYSDAAEVFAAAAIGDLAAKSAIERAAHAVGAAVGVLIAVLGPQVVVLGGGVGSRAEFVEAVRRTAVCATQPNAASLVEIGGSPLGGLSSLYGAAHLAHQLMEISG